LSDIRRSDIFRGHFGKNFHGCPMSVLVKIVPPLAYPPKQLRYKDSAYQDVYKDGWEIEMLRIIEKALNFHWIL
jgi:hypothetical protein